ncbi:hypothetical protein GGI43DRAFT_124292 [Trichoderma evansii]
MAGALVCPSCSQKAAGIPCNVAANATLCLSLVQVSWIGHSRDRSLPPGRQARSRRMPNMAWERLLSLHSVKWIKASCPLLPVSFLRRDGTACSLFNPCPLSSISYKCYSVLLFTILLLAHLAIYQDPAHVMAHPRRKPQEMEAPLLLLQCAPGLRDPASRGLELGAYCNTRGQSPCIVGDPHQPTTDAMSELRS